MGFNFKRMTWHDGRIRYEVERETEEPGKWCVEKLSGLKWENLYMTERQLFRVLYDHGRKDSVPLELLAEFDDEPDRHDLS